jgi:hypothetical protein
MLASLPVYGILSASVLSHRNIGRMICACIVTFLILYLPRAYSQSNEDFRSFGEAVSASTNQGDLIVFAGPAQTYSPQILYLAASYYSRPLPGPVLLIQTPAKTELMAKLKTRQTIWLAADPTVLFARDWLPGYHLVAGKSWPQVGSFLEMQRNP